jgi:MFS family permease
MPEHEGSVSVESAQVLRSPRFRRVLASNVITMLGSAAAPVALAFAALGTGGETFTLGIVLAANAIPSILILLYGGVLADRVSRSVLLVGGRIVAGTAQLLVAILVLTASTTTIALGVLAFVSGAAAAVMRPASMAIFKQLVDVSALQQAYALNRLSSNIVRVGAPVIAGVAVAVTSPGWVLVFDAATFFVSALLMLGVQLQAAVRVAVTSPWQDLREGLREVGSRSWLLANMFFGAVIVVLWRVGFELAGPAISKQGYGGAAAWGVIESAFAVGLVVGGFVCLRWKTSPAGRGSDSREWGTRVAAAVSGPASAGCLCRCGGGSDRGRPRCRDRDLVDRTGTAHSRRAPGPCAIGELDR